MTINGFSATSVNFTVPNIEAGAYLVRVRLDPVGETNSLPLTITSVISTNSITGSVNGGSIVLQGFGFPTAWPAQLWTLLMTISNVPVPINIISINSSRIELAIPAGLDGTKYFITLTNPLGGSNTATFTQSNSQSPLITLTSPTTSTASGSITVKLNRTSILSSTNPANISIYNTLNPNKLYPISSWAYNGSGIVFTYNFPAGAYGFKLWYTSVGWATCSAVL